MASHPKPCLPLLKLLLSIRGYLSGLQKAVALGKISPHEPKSTPIDNSLSLLMLCIAILKNVLYLWRFSTRTEPQLPLAGPPGLYSFFFLYLLLFPYLLDSECRTDKGNWQHSVVLFWRLEVQVKVSSNRLGPFKASVLPTVPSYGSSCEQTLLECLWVCISVLLQ